MQPAQQHHRPLTSMENLQLVTLMARVDRGPIKFMSSRGNILINRIDFKLSSGNIFSDISDHYSQFCIIHSLSLKARYHGTKICDYSRFSGENIISDISQTDWAGLITNGSVDKCFSSIHNKLNKLVKRHAPLKIVSKRNANNYLNRG